MAETKREKFDRLATARFANAKKSMGLLQNLSGPNYDGDQQDKQNIVDDLMLDVENLAKVYNVPLEKSTLGPSETTTGKLPIEGIDRRDIRIAFAHLRSGEEKQGLQLLQKVILGWPVPDKIKGDN